MHPRVIILSAFATPFRSGAEACSEEVARALSGRFEVTIITSRLRRALPRSDRLPGGVPLLRVGLGSSIDPWLFPFLAPLAARKLKPDLVHAVLESFAGLALVLCRFLLPHARRVLTLQSTNTSFLLGLMHRSAHSLTAISASLAARAREFGRHDVTIIPNGIPSASIRDAAARVKKAFPERILFVGRLEPMKGVDTLLDAYALLPEHFKARTVLRIVGDGSRRSMLGVKSGQLDIAAHVTFPGYIPVPAIFEEYARAAIFCGLSRSEALGNVFLEAQAAGLPVIATRVGGIPEIVKDGETGFLVPPDDPRTASAALAKLLTNATLCEKMGEAGKRFAEGFDWKKIAEEYAGVYVKLLAA